MTACIVGWAHRPFGKLDGETLESLIVKVAGEALVDAGIAAKDVDEIVLGHFNAGFSAQDFTASWSCRPQMTCASNAQRVWRTPAPRAPPPCIRGSRRSRHALRASCLSSAPSR